MSRFTRKFRALYDHFDPGPRPEFEEGAQDSDVEMTIEDDEQDDQEPDVMDHDPVSILEKDRIIIAVDFGTTFSSVAYAVLGRGVPPERISVQKVKCIGNYPGYEAPAGLPDTRQDVPTELWYSDDHPPFRRSHSINGEESSSSEEEFPGSELDSSSSEDGMSDSEPSQFEDDGGLEANSATQPRNLRTTSVTQYWGFNVQRHLNVINIPNDDAHPLARFKLKLADPKSSQIQEDNEEIRKNIEEVRSRLDMSLLVLRKKKIIKHDSDIYADYLTHLLGHTQEQLKLSNELHEDMIVQFVLCVPAKWPVDACRIMQNAMEQAVQNAGFSPEAQKGVHNIFMISEPEAAAECILAEERSELYRDETVVIIDAGGGTIDAVTYKCANDEPLRLSEEVVAPDSKVFGASFINKKFEDKLLEKLRGEHYLIQNGKTLKSIVQACATAFENNEKRKIDINNLRNPIAPIYIDNLREDPAKHFYQNRLELKRKTVKTFFDKPLQGVTTVLENQLQLAQTPNQPVHKVILTGGFGQSPSLQSHLRKYLKGINNPTGCDIDLIVPRNPSTAVARGAVLRALNKRLGPSRISQCSYGILISEPYEPELYEEHRKTTCRINKADGERYVDETIHWVIQAGERVGNMQEFSFDVKHTFAMTRTRLQAAEQLWMSDKPHPLHYRRTHAYNKGAKKIGTIVADLTDLRDEGLIKPELPSEFSTHFPTQKKHWEIHYEVVMTVEGRSIRFEARWPSKGNLKQGQEQRTYETKLVGIAAAFKPGTA